MPPPIIALLFFIELFYKSKATLSKNTAPPARAATLLYSVELIKLNYFLQFIA